MSTPTINFACFSREHRRDYEASLLCLAKCFAFLKASELREVCAIDHNTGSIDSDKKEFAVKPTGSPFATGSPNWTRALVGAAPGGMAVGFAPVEAIKAIAFRRRQRLR